MLRLCGIAPERTHVLERFKSPVLFIAGEKDGGISPESVKKQSELNPKSILHVLPEVAHMGMFEKERLTLELTKGVSFKSKPVYRPVKQAKCPISCLF
jgi:pimeloyl-ACP methyl ester carboxylesterase